MADSKVSELTSATSLGGSDVLYLVQSNTSKKITAATVFANAANVTLKDVITVGSTPQSLGAAGIISLSTPITHLSVGGDSGTLQIPTGSDGQVKILVMTSSSGGTYTINNANLAANANVVFEQAGHSAQLLYTNSKWFVIGGTANVTY
jgi:hypothetical protein